MILHLSIELALCHRYPLRRVEIVLEASARGAEMKSRRCAWTQIAIITIDAMGMQTSMPCAEAGA